MAPFRREWAEIKGELAAAYAKGKGNAAQRERLAEISETACRRHACLTPRAAAATSFTSRCNCCLGLEKEVITFATQLGFAFKPQVTVQQLRPLKSIPTPSSWRKCPCKSAICNGGATTVLTTTARPFCKISTASKTKTPCSCRISATRPRHLKEAQAGEHAGDDALKFYTEREWPAVRCHRRQSAVSRRQTCCAANLGDDYVDELFENLRQAHSARQPTFAATGLKKHASKLKKANANARACWRHKEFAAAQTAKFLKRIKDTGDIFFAESDRDWILAGANVHVSMIGFDDGAESSKLLDGKTVERINPNLTGHRTT